MFHIAVRCSLRLNLMVIWNSASGTPLFQSLRNTIGLFRRNKKTHLTVNSSETHSGSLLSGPVATSSIINGQEGSKLVGVKIRRMYVVGAAAGSYINRQSHGQIRLVVVVLVVAACLEYFYMNDEVGWVGGKIMSIIRLVTDDSTPSGWSMVRIDVIKMCFRGQTD